MSEAEKKVAVGACEEIEQKPGSEWVGFKINVGTQYPIKLSTKLPKLIEEARAIGGEVATWTYKESDGNPNPNNPGTFYKNRWLDSVVLGAHAAVAAPAPAPAQAPASGSAPAPRETSADERTVDWDAKERRDYRSRAWAHTISLYSHTISKDEDVAAVFQRLQPIHDRIYRDIVRDLDPTGTADDSDIPF